MPEAVTWSHKERTVLLWQQSHALWACSGQAWSLWMHLGNGCPALQTLLQGGGWLLFPEVARAVNVGLCRQLCCLFTHPWCCWWLHWKH